MTRRQPESVEEGGVREAEEKERWGRGLHRSGGCYPYCTVCVHDN